MNLTCRIYLLQTLKLIEYQNSSSFYFYLNSQELGEEVFKHSTKYLYTGFQIINLQVQSAIILPICSYYECSNYFFSFLGVIQKTAKLFDNYEKVLEPWQLTTLIFILFYEEKNSLYFFLQQKLLFNYIKLINKINGIFNKIDCALIDGEDNQMVDYFFINELFKKVIFCLIIKQNIVDLNFVKKFNDKFFIFNKQNMNKLSKFTVDFIFNEKIDFIFNNLFFKFGLFIIPILPYFKDSYFTDSITKLSKFMALYSKYWHNQLIL